MRKHGWKLVLLLLLFAGCATTGKFTVEGERNFTNPRPKVEVTVTKVW